MKVALLPVGTRGDVQPMVALGVELRSRGHDVVVASGENFRPLIEGHGLAFASPGLKMASLVQSYGAPVASQNEYAVNPVITSLSSGGIVPFIE